MHKKPNKREIENVKMWLSGTNQDGEPMSVQELANKLRVSRIGAYSTIARVAKHLYQ